MVWLRWRNKCLISRWSHRNKVPLPPDHRRWHWYRSRFLSRLIRSILHGLRLWRNVYRQCHNQSVDVHWSRGGVRVWLCCKGSLLQGHTERWILRRSTAVRCAHAENRHSWTWDRNEQGGIQLQRGTNWLLCGLPGCWGKCGRPAVLCQLQWNWITSLLGFNKQHRMVLAAAHTMGCLRAWGHLRQPVRNQVHKCPLSVHRSDSMGQLLSGNAGVQVLHNARVSGRIPFWWL